MPQQIYYKGNSMRADSRTYLSVFRGELGPYKLVAIYVFCISCLYVLLWPVGSADTDLWYHLNGGRYFSETSHIPTDSFFSFLAPKRERVNYYWLFQISVYQIYRQAGYYGIIVLRALLYFLTLYYIMKFLRKKIQTPFGVLIFLSLFSIMMVHRGLLVRPHLFSYFFIVFFLYHLENRSRLSLLLPLFAVFWVNLHGIEYPILLLMVWSYILEEFYLRHSDKAKNGRADHVFLILMGGAMLSIFLTPYGWHLLNVPFISTEYASTYIQELIPLKVKDFFIFRFEGFSPTPQTAFNVYFFVSLFIIAMRISSRKTRLSHLLLWAGGIYLLCRSQRFTVEYILLSLPILCSRPLKTENNAVNTSTVRNLKAVTAFVIIGMTSSFFLGGILNRPAYPITYENMPHGVASFLKETPVRGKILNFPTSGGYLQWMVWPRDQIAMDMEVPHLFSDEEFFQVIQAYFDPASFDKLVTLYAPDFITVPFRFDKYFKKIRGRHTDYTLVIFDDTQMLYVDRQAHPKLAAQFDMGDLDPIQLTSMGVSSMSAEKRKVLLARLIKIEPYNHKSRLINWWIGSLLKEAGDFDRASRYAQKLIDDYPDVSGGYILKGDILLGKKAWGAAIASYKAGLKKTVPKERSRIYRKLWQCYVGLDRPKAAYAALKKAVKIYTPAASYLDLFQLALTSMQVGKRQDAVFLARLALWKVPEKEVKWRKRIEGRLQAWQN